MSYSSDLKKEICQIEVSDDILKYELKALLVFRAEVGLSNHRFNLSYKTTSNYISRHIISVVKRLYQADIEVVSKKQNKLDYKDIFKLTINDANSILEDLGMINYAFAITEYIPTFNNLDEMLSYLKGAFIAHGSINDPETSSYHLEFVCPSLVQAKIISDILIEINIENKLIEREKGIVVYIKKAEAIGDFLRYMGASRLLFAFEDLRILKDLNNYANRMANCDIANEQKAMQTAKEQIEAIEVIMNNYPLDKLDEKMLFIINLRNENPEDSLKELSEKSEEFGMYISKSTLSNRFKQLVNMAKEIKNGKTYK